MSSLTRLFILLGIVFLLVGGLIYLFSRFNLPLGRLPGDIRIEGEKGMFYFPLASSVVISILLTLILNLLIRLFRR